MRIKRRSNLNEVIASTQFSANKIAKTGKLIAKHVVEAQSTIEKQSKLREIVHPTLSY